MRGFAAAAVEFVNLSAAAESVGEDHRARCSAWAPAAVTRCCTRRSRGIVGYVLGSPADLIEDSKAIQPGEAASFTLLQEQLHSVLGTPSEREAGMATMRFGLTDGQPKTLGEIGKVYGVTRKRIRQIESTTMSKLEPKSAPIGGSVRFDQAGHQSRCVSRRYQVGESPITGDERGDGWVPIAADTARRRWHRWPLGCQPPPDRAEATRPGRPRIAAW